MYLTLIRLNLRSRRVQYELANRYELHRTLMHAFKPELPVGERMLYRLEPARGGMNILVQTHNEPDWRFFSGDDFFGYLLGVQDNPQMKTFDPVFQSGRQFIFRLQANLTCRRVCGAGNSNNKRRFGLYKAEEQIAWLIRKSEAAGFVPLDVRTTDLGLVFGTQKKSDKTHQVKLFGVQFDGLLEITDAALFSSAMSNGIGSAKGFGFGLLSLSRA
jgi:CRISPR system Cascade subunit CasE